MPIEDFKLTAHFSFFEMTDTQVPGELDNNRKSAMNNINDLKLFCHTLEFIREMVGCPIIVNSGYRSPVVNRAVKGAVDSAHLYGKAADIRVSTPEKMRELLKIIEWLYIRSYIKYYKVYKTYFHINL